MTETEPPLAVTEPAAEAADVVEAPATSPPRNPDLIPLPIVIWGPATFVVVLFLILFMLRESQAYLALTAFPYSILMLGVGQLIPDLDTPDFALYGGIGLAFLLWLATGTLYVRVLGQLPKRSVWAWQWMLRFMYAGLGSALACAVMAFLQIIANQKIAAESPQLTAPASISPIPSLVIVVILAIWHDAMTGPGVRRWLEIDEAAVRRQIRSAWLIVAIFLTLGLGYWYLALSSYSMGLSHTEQFKLNVLPWQDDPMPTVEEWERNQ